MYSAFTHTLRKAGVPASTAQLVDLLEGIDMGLAPSLEDLYFLAKATFVKKDSQELPFRNAFFSHFFGLEVAEEKQRIRGSPRFAKWREDHEILQLLNEGAPPPDSGTDEELQEYIADKLNANASRAGGRERIEGYSHDANSDRDDIERGLPTSDMDGRSTQGRQGMPWQGQDGTTAGAPARIGGRAQEDGITGRGQRGELGATPMEGTPQVGAARGTGNQGQQGDRYQQLGAEELEQLLQQRIMDQRHGPESAGTYGVGPHGHGGRSKWGIRISGKSSTQAAQKVRDAQKRHHEYNETDPLGQEQLRTALEELRLMKEHGPRKLIDVERTVANAGKHGMIRPYLKARRYDRMEIAVFLDNGGTSMDAHHPIVETLVSKMRSQLSTLRTYYFHNCIYQDVAIEPTREKKIPLDEILLLDRETRVFIIGDAKMNPQTELNMQTLQSLRDRFKQSIWVNPLPPPQWRHFQTVDAIHSIFPMYPLTYEGLRSGVQYLTGHKNGTRFS